MLDESLNQITFPVLLDLTPGLGERRKNLDVRVLLSCKKVDINVLNSNPVQLSGLYTAVQDMCG
jgi:hypothetical protein